MNIGIIGQGFVGNAVKNKFEKFYNILTYDIDNSLCNSTLLEIKNNCKVIFLCLPTPMKNNGECDISRIYDTIKILSDKDEIIVVNKSTVVPGTTEKLNEEFKRIQIVFNPEFLTERNAIEDYENQNRIILGGPRSATTILKTIFSRVFPNVYLVKTGSKHAEMIKYFTNSFLATKVSFANEMYDLCRKLDVDYDKVIEYATLDKRIGFSHLAVPGPDGDLGFGGHCFPKDLAALIYLSENLGSLNNVLNAVNKTNDKVRSNRDWERMKGRAIN